MMGEKTKSHPTPLQSVLNVGARVPLRSRLRRLVSLLCFALFWRDTTEVDILRLRHCPSLVASSPPRLSVKSLTMDLEETPATVSVRSRGPHGQGGCCATQRSPTTRACGGCVTYVAISVQRVQHSLISLIYDTCKPCVAALMLPPFTWWEVREKKLSLPLHEALGIILEACCLVLRG